MSYTGHATCSECGSSHTSTQATQARADSIAQQSARSCASRDRDQKAFEAARQRKAAEEAARRAEAERRAAERRRKK